MKGKISNKVDGALRKVIKKGKKILISKSLKYEISSKILKIKIKAKNIPVMINNFLTNNLIK